MDYLKEQVKKVVDLLVSKQYAALVELTHGSRLDREMIETAIREYRRELIAPPEAAFDRLDVVEVDGADPPRWSVRCNLWTREEGRSDLSVELTVTRRDNGYGIELDDIHVL
jgi:hypothetical protein